MDEWRITTGVSNHPGEVRDLLAGVALHVGSEERGDARTETIASVRSSSSIRPTAT
jgi:hypothetical protein